MARGLSLPASGLWKTMHQNTRRTLYNVIIAVALISLAAALLYRRPSGPAKDGAPLPALACTCKEPVYDWEREDIRHKKFAGQRNGFYNYIKKEEGFAKDIPSHILHGMQPTMSCADVQRYGGITDGGKVMCEARRLLKESTSEECIVYSFGVGGDCRFELDLLDEFPHCSVYLFDPTLEESFATKSECAKRGHFYAWGLRGVEPLTKVPEKERPSYVTLPTVLQRLGHTGKKLHVLKIDIEGSEYDALLYLMAPENQHIMFNTNVLMLELHPIPSFETQKKLLPALEERGMRLYYTERNPFFPSVGVELSLLNSTALRGIDKAQACSGR